MSTTPYGSVGGLVEISCVDALLASSVFLACLAVISSRSVRRCMWVTVENSQRLPTPWELPITLAILSMYCLRTWSPGFPWERWRFSGEDQCNRSSRSPRMVKLRQSLPCLCGSILGRRCAMVIMVIRGSGASRYGVSRDAPARIHSRGSWWGQPKDDGI